jgi:hypothetical protein
MTRGVMERWSSIIILMMMWHKITIDPLACAGVGCQPQACKVSSKNWGACMCTRLTVASVLCVEHKLRSRVACFNMKGHCVGRLLAIADAFGSRL